MKWNEIEKEVWRRANHRCEYCRMHQSLQGATFHVEHITPRSEGGASNLDNLAIACPRCNLKKSNKTLVSDPKTGESVSLFNPREDVWDEQYFWEGYSLVPFSAKGRATIAALDLNEPRRITIRKVEEQFELFPP